MLVIDVIDGDTVATEDKMRIRLAAGFIKLVNCYKKVHGMAI